MAMTATERVQLVSNASATGNDRLILGGKYRFRASATFGGGTVKLQSLGPDSVTYIDVAGSSLTAAGDVALDLPAGSYRAAIATATAVFADLCRVPV